MALSVIRWDNIIAALWDIFPQKMFKNLVRTFLRASNQNVKLHKFIGKISVKLGGGIKSIRTFHVLKIASSILSQLASLYLVYLLAPSEYGIFALVATLAQLMFVLTSGWSNAAVINLGSQSFARSGEYKDIIIYRSTIVSAAFVLISFSSFMLGPWIVRYMNIEGLFAYVWILYVGYVFYEYGSQLLYPGDRNDLQSGLELIACSAIFATVIFAVNDFQSYIYSYVAVSIAFAVTVGYLFFGAHRKKPFKWVSSEFKRVFIYCRWQIISVVSIYLINMGVNYILVLNKIPLVEIGLYNFAYRLYVGFAPVFSLLVILVPKMIYAPDFSHKSFDRWLSRIAIYLAGLYLFSGVVLHIVLAELEMQSYFPSIKYYFWLFPSFIMSIYINMLNCAISNTSLFYRSQFAILAQALILLILSYFLTAYLGLSGVFVAIFASNLICVTYLGKIYKLAMRGNLKQI